jgi:general secretion pathway protein G
MNRRQRRKSAFTLIELVVVMLILAILAAMIVPRIIGRSEDAKVARAVSDLATVRSMLDNFRIDVGRYPSTEEGLEALRSAPADASGWRGPYSQKPIGVDPWGKEYIYEWPGNDGDDSYFLLSYGADGVEGGEGNNEDIIEAGE